MPSSCTTPTGSASIRAMPTARTMNAVIHGIVASSENDHSRSADGAAMTSTAALTGA